ncbi:hypothetical protein D5400_11770 [Georhizobium profundi]|uniref:Uncharacterized protein n=1 Tax=Georhizobium profundi TaxID=2341112 RepID=A0A3Q8XPC3_9HYPH|nr:hypothetical protein [Georhizobium profundi]AZN71866.1 hypothetical protein D5400_11770 [Georhizobium profundi]
MATPFARVSGASRLKGAAFREPSDFADGRIVLSPFQFQGKGNGLQDDTGAINAMFDRFRDIVGGGAEQKAAVEISLSGGKWRVDETIDATRISSWNWKMTGGSIYGHCAGKPIMDLSGSRGYEINGVGFIGDRDNMPRTAWQAARLEESMFCDNIMFLDCSSNGFFSEAAWVAYGQETANHHHCTWWNNHHDAHIGIIEGFDAHPFTSEFGTVITGPTSNINISMTGNCDLRYLPFGNQWEVQGVTTGANAVVTAPGHEFAIGDPVCFAYVGGMPELSKLIATVTAVTSDTFTTNLNTTTLGTFTDGGLCIRRQTKSTLYTARTEGLSLPDLYIVAYGQPQIQVGFPDTTFPLFKRLRMPNVLFEGSGNENNVYFDNDPVDDAKLLGFELSTYNANATVSLLGIGPDALSIYGPTIDVSNDLWGVDMVNDPDQCSMYGARVVYSTLAKTRHADMQRFNGHITSIQSGNTYPVGLEPAI